MLKLLYYTASWCIPCKQFRPLASKEAFDRGLEIEFVDVDEATEAASMDDVFGVPTILILDENNVAIDRVVGASLPTLKKTLDKLTR